MGIPGNPGAAMLLGAMMVQGIIPVPLMFKNHIDIVAAIFLIMFIANIAMIIIEFFGLRLFLIILLVPSCRLLPIVLVMCTTGAFSTNHRIFGVWCIIFFALLRYGMQKFKYPVSPLVLGYNLGRLFEVNLCRALM